MSSSRTVFGKEKRKQDERANNIAVAKAKPIRRKRFTFPPPDEDSLQHWENI